MDIQPITEKLVHVEPDSYKCNLVYGTYEQVLANPIEVVGMGLVVKVTAEVTHDGHHYYLEDPTVLLAYESNRCTDFVPPPAPRALPSAPITAPNTERYHVVKELVGYSSRVQALEQKEVGRQVIEGEYYVYNKHFVNGAILAVNVTNVLGQSGAWIATADNVPDPEPEVEYVIPEKTKEQKDAELAEVRKRWAMEAVEAKAPDLEPEEVAMVVDMTPVVEAVPDVPKLPQPPVDWRKSYHPYIDKHGFKYAKKYYVLHDLFLEDPYLEAKNQFIAKGSILHVAGEFDKNGTRFARWKQSSDEYRWLSTPFIDKNGVQLLALYSPPKKITKHHYAILTHARTQKVYHTFRDKLNKNP